MKLTKENSIKVNVIVDAPTKRDLDKLFLYDNTISIYLSKGEGPNIARLIVGPRDCWQIINNEFGQYYSFRYNFYKKEEFLKKISEEDLDWLNWILFHPEVLTGKYFY